MDTPFSQIRSRPGLKLDWDHFSGGKAMSPQGSSSVAVLGLSVISHELLQQMEFALLSWNCKCRFIYFFVCKVFTFMLEGRHDRKVIHVMLSLVVRDGISEIFSNN